MATTDRSNVGQRGVSRVLIKLENSIEKGEYYEAHQMYRTLYFRYTTQKRYKDCLELLFSGAAKLLTKQQQSSAADLCLLLVDTLEKSCVANVDSNNDDENILWINRLGTLIGGLGANIVERDTLISRTVKWTSATFGNTHGHPTLHKIIAQVFWNERNIEQARQHFLLSQDGNLCGRILIQINETRGFASEVDIFIVQAVLQQLCLKDRQTAEETFNIYTRNHSQILRKTRPYKQPLLNFIYFLFRLIDMKNLALFRTLRQLYEPSLCRDLSFAKYLSKIGAIYFDEAPVVRSTAGGGLMGGMFGDIFSRLLQGFDEEDDDEMEAAPRRPNNTQSNELD